MRSMASANMGATEIYLILLQPSPIFSGMVFSRATSLMTLLFRRSSAGPDSTPWLAQAYTLLAPPTSTIALAALQKDIFIPAERSKGAVSGHKVVVELTDYGYKDRKPEGKVVEIIGHINDPGTDIMSIVRAYDLPVEFSEKIMHQVENVSNEVSTADMAGRMDLRN